jgi:hypothetical protein
MSITAANASMYLTSSVSFPAPQKVEQWATDEAFAATAVKLAEIYMGVDGKKSSGYTPYLVPLKLSLQADSDSMSIFDTLIGTQAALRVDEVIDITLTIPAIAMQFVFTNGTMETVQILPDAGKVLKKRDFELKFESFAAQPI